MLCLFINLERSFDRRLFMENELSQLKIPFERIKAIDGRFLSDEFISEIAAKQFSTKKAWFPYHLIHNEYACFLSHKKCWERLINSDHEYASILEDDIILTAESTKYLSNSEWIPQKVQLLSLCAPLEPKIFRVKNQRTNLPPQYNGSLYEIISPPITSAAAYIISRDAAKVALKLTDKISAPVDEFLFSPKSPLRSHFPIFKLNPGIGYQRCINSTITDLPRNGSKPFLSRLHPIAILYKIKLTYLELKYRKQISFFTPNSKSHNTLH